MQALDLVVVSDRRRLHAGRSLTTARGDPHLREILPPPAWPGQAVPSWLISARLKRASALTRRLDG